MGATLVGGIELRAADLEGAIAELDAMAADESEIYCASMAVFGSEVVADAAARVDELVWAVCASLGEIAAILVRRLRTIGDEFDLLDQTLGAAP